MKAALGVSESGTTSRDNTCVTVGCGRPVVKRERCEGCVQKHDAKRIQIATALIGSEHFNLAEEREPDEDAMEVVRVACCRALKIADLLLEEALR